MTASGYPRIVKRWKRGTPLSAAETLAEGEHEDVGMNVFALVDGDKRWPMISRGKTFYTADIKLPNVDASRSEEHTSELQSLMRISYAVFCLNKKKQNEYMYIIP